MKIATSQGPILRSSAPRAKAHKPETQAQEPRESAELSGSSEVISRHQIGSQQRLAAINTAVQSAVASSLPPTLAGPISDSFQKGFVQDYLSPREIRERCQALQEQFPHLVQIIETGHQSHGYDGKRVSEHGTQSLYYLRIGPQNEEREAKTGVFQYAAPHARELVNPMTMMELTEQLVRNYDPASENPEIVANTRLLDSLDIFIAPMTNPDGSNFALHDDPMWRKNRVPVGEGKVGVDINRNYPYQWQASTRPGSQTYSGVGPASEAETQAILKTVENHPNIKFVVDWHSHGQELRRPQGVSAEDNALYDELHARVSKAIASVAKNEYRAVVSQVIHGTSDDHFYHTAGVISTVMETGREFAPPTKEALVVMEESVAGAREFLQAALDREAS